MRSLTALLRKAMAAETTAEGALILLTIDHPTLDAPYRLVRNLEPVTSRTNVFSPFPIDVLIPDDMDDQPPSSPLSIDNLDRSIIVWLRGADPSPTFLIELVALSDPDVPAEIWGPLTAQEFDYDINTITTTTNAASDPQEPASDWVFSPSAFPSLSWVVRSV